MFKVAIFIVMLMKEGVIILQIRQEIKIIHSTLNLITKK
jgi:hypothetical protein